MSHLRDNLLRGVGSLIDLMPPPATPDFSRGIAHPSPAPSDWEAIGGDFARVGDDLASAMRKYDRTRPDHERRDEPKA